MPVLVKFRNQGCHVIHKINLEKSPSPTLSVNPANYLFFNRNQSYNPAFFVRKTLRFF